ncbi:MAG: replication-associated recombination protein A [Ignavibacteriales bacterium]|nr:replication-associated recombination protein A [Ignavibacteriales bacterium]
MDSHIDDIFDEKTEPALDPNVPLAERVRPRTIDEFVGQSHLLGEGKPLRLMAQNDDVRSIILWGPPGVGKTTFARMLASHTKAAFFSLNAVSAGVKDVREVILKAELMRKRSQRRTVLFIDEIHRFNKAQQDALLHSVESGILTLIGATTENPSFEVISPLLSRMRVFILESLGVQDLSDILRHALRRDSIITEQSVEILDPGFLFLLSGGDARKMLNGLEAAFQMVAPDGSGRRTIDHQILEDAFQKRMTMYDKTGEQHYDIISAFIKSIRGIDPDAGVYLLALMLDGGEDPKFIARRLLVLASEDVGNADPVAAMLATSCFAAVDYVGMPEARIILAQCVTYLASAPKSNASYNAVSAAWDDVRQMPNLPVPIHLRNAPTKLMKDLEYGREYKYSHDFVGHFVEQQFLPDNVKDKVYYHPTEEGREKIIKDRLKSLWKKKYLSGRKGSA